VRITAGALTPDKFVKRTPSITVYPDPEISAINVTSFDSDFAEMALSLGSMGDGASRYSVWAELLEADTVVRTTNIVTDATVLADQTIRFDGLEALTAYTVKAHMSNDISENVSSVSVGFTTKETAGAILLYKFNKKDVGSGGSIANHGTYGVQLENSGAVEIGGQAAFDGSSSLRSAGFSYNGINILTAECFAKPVAGSEASAGLMIGSSGEPGSKPGSYHLCYVSGEAPCLRLVLNYQGDWDCNYVDAPFAPDGKWHHFAVVVNPNKATGKSAYLYIDYELAAELDWKKNGNEYKAFGYGWDMFSVGGVWNDSRYYFNGEIDDVRVYNRALTPEQFLRKRDKGFDAFMLLVR